MTEGERPRLRLVPPLPEPECLFGNGDHGECGGPSNGRECWQHARCVMGCTHVPDPSDDRTSVRTDGAPS